MPADKFYMKLTLRLARKGLGTTSPNPMVGAVIVKKGRIIGSGYHKRAGLGHAEIEALKSARTNARGATLYVNLEPCDHFGRTPPCTDAIIKSGIKKVVAAMKDPSPLNNGRGFRRLQMAGIAVKRGVLEDEAKELNEVFIKYTTKKMPFVIVKVAQSIDGKIAANTGDSKWISSPQSRRYVHQLRGRVDAIMIGANTVMKDNPLLTVRNQAKILKQPVKIIVDSGLRIPINAKIFSGESPAKVIIATTKKAPKIKIPKLKKIGAEILILKDKNGKIDLRQLMKELAKRAITSVLVEGGGTLIGSLVDAKLIDKYLFFISPKIIGGKDAITSVEGSGVDKISQAASLKNIKYKKFDKDLLIEGTHQCSQE